MIVVIQCAARKRAGAGFLHTKSGRKVLFVANPAQAPKTDELLYTRPDDLADSEQTWRDKLIGYNKGAPNNPFGLYCAYEIYENNVYRQLVQRFGIENTFVLSAGWGLISAAFLIPLYDITFSASVRTTAPYKFRHKKDVYRDLRQLSAESEEPIVFIGGKDYVPLFCTLTENARGRRFIYYNSTSAPKAPGCTLQRFVTSTKTNWHYECAAAFIEGRAILNGLR